jgi:hypothetical protein
MKNNWALCFYRSGFPQSLEVICTTEEEITLSVLSKLEVIITWGGGGREGFLSFYQNK